MMKFLNLAVLTLALGVLACGGEDESGSGENACDYIVGNNYSSVEDLECGVGKSPCPWQLFFNSDMRYEYRHSDQVSYGDYSCKGLSIQRVTPSGGLSEAGTYEVETATVTWGEVAYQ